MSRKALSKFRESLGQEHPVGWNEIMMLEIIFFRLHTHTVRVRPPGPERASPPGANPWLNISLDVSIIT